MTEISNHFKKLDNYIVIELNPETDMQDGLLYKLNSEVINLLKSLNFNLTLFNIFSIGAN